MKTPKILLTIIIVLAIVGGALAFKAKNFNAQNYCYTTTTAAQAACILGVTFRTFTAPTVVNYKYTTTFITSNCAFLPPNSCTSIGRMGGF